MKFPRYVFKVVDDEHKSVIVNDSEEYHQAIVTGWFSTVTEAIHENSAVRRLPGVNVSHRRGRPRKSR